MGTRATRLRKSRLKGQSPLGLGGDGGWAAPVAGAEHDKLHDERTKFNFSTDFDASQYKLYEEFFNIPNAGITVAQSLGVGSVELNGANAQGSANASIAHHPGILNLETGTTNAGYAFYHLKNIDVGSGAIRVGAVVKTPANLSSALNTFVIYMGLSASSDPSTSSNSIVFYHDAQVNAKWRAKVDDTVTPTTVNVGDNVTSGTWYNLEILVDANATAASFYLNGDYMTTITGNLPTVNMSALVGITKTVGATSRPLLVDNYFLIGELLDESASGGAGPTLKSSANNNKRTPVLGGFLRL